MFSAMQFIRGSNDAFQAGGILTIQRRTSRCSETVYRRWGDGTVYSSCFVSLINSGPVISFRFFPRSATLNQLIPFLAPDEA